MAFEIDPDILYYFLCKHEDKYINLFIGWIRPDMALAFQELDEESGQAYIKINVGMHSFTCIVDRPLFLVEIEKDMVFQFAGDNNELKLFPDDQEPPDDVPQIVDFPSYFNEGIEPLLDFKMGKEFCKNEAGVWIPLQL